MHKHGKSNLQKAVFDTENHHFPLFNIQDDVLNFSGTGNCEDIIFLK